MIANAADALVAVSTPAAEIEVHVLLFEPKGTVNTGSAHSEKTIHDLEIL